MKKTVLVGLIGILILGCKKVEKGVMIIENKSAYSIDIKCTQNYSSEFMTLLPNDLVECSWERYFFCFIEKPHTNLLKREDTKEKITIFNNDKLHAYRVINGVPDLTMLELLDENQFILALPDGTPTDSISLNPGISTINTFIRFSIKNMIFNKGTPFSVGGEICYPIEKKGDFYYFNKLTDGRLESKKINIDLLADEIIISS